MELLFSKAQQQAEEIDVKALLIKQQQQILDLQQQVLTVITQNTQLLLALQKFQSAPLPVQPAPQPSVQNIAPSAPVNNPPVQSSPPVPKPPSIERVQYMLQQSGRRKRKRSATFATQAHLLLLLHRHHHTGIAPASLFAQAGIAARTGYRHIALLKKKKMARFHRSKTKWTLHFNLFGCCPTHAGIAEVRFQ